MLFSFGLIFLAAFASASYTGQFDYMSVARSDAFEYTFTVFINEPIHELVFTGVENPLDIRTISYDSSNHFTVKLNDVWFDGWFDANNLYINQYVSAHSYHSGSAQQISPGIYSGQIPFVGPSIFGYPVVYYATITLDYMTHMSYLTSSYGISSSAPIGSSGASLIFVRPLLLETTLDTSHNLTVINAHQWIKEDLATNGLTPRWIISLTSV